MKINQRKMYLNSMKFKMPLLLMFIIGLLICFLNNNRIVANQHHNADIVMFGDSITFKGKWSELFPDINIVNLGVEGDTAYNLKKRIGQVYRYNPKYCFILVGFNDICNSKDDVNFIYENYTYILKKLVQRDINPIIMSTTYASDLLKDYEQINTKIDILNNMLKKYALDNGIIFVDLNKYITKNHYLSRKFAKDHVHLNDKAYKIWKDQITGIIKNDL